MNLAENIRRARLNRGMTQSALADVLGVSDRAVSRWETGAACPDVTLLPRLALVLETSADALCWGWIPFVWRRKSSRRRQNALAC